MENRISRPLVSRSLWLLLSLAAFIGAFQTAYYQDMGQMKGLAKLALSHFQYADSLHDDMGVIDWSKDLEKLDQVRTFRIKINGRVVAEGGNRDLLPIILPEGAVYRFPSNWTYRITSSSDPAKIEAFELGYSSAPGPLVWGLAVGCWTFFIGGAFLFLPIFNVRKTEPAQIDRSQRTIAPAQPLIPNQDPDPKEVGSAGPAGLFVDSHFIIQEAGNEAASLLGKSSQNLRSLHLFDLNPDSALVQAMEKGEEAEIPNPLPEYGKMKASLKLVPGGFHILLKSQKEPKTP